MITAAVDIAIFLLVVTVVTEKDSITDGGVVPYPESKYSNTDEKLSQKVNLKYFNELNRNLGLTWKEGGQNITFNGSNLSIQDANNFISDNETIFIAHGFNSKAEGAHGCETFVQTYNQTGRNVQVICIDWRELAALRYAAGIYEKDAQNSVNVGWWLGRMLHTLVKMTDLDPNKIHLIGHSLGAHLVGMMGRTFSSLSGSKVGRITGLDPAGPLFVKNGLKDHRIKKDDGAFVDIIHTNGDFNPLDLGVGLMEGVHFGDLHALGHADFYPNGGMEQDAAGCTVGLTGHCIDDCCHGRSVDFYLHSILDGPSAFAAYPCASAEQCSKGKKTGENVVNQMGEYATKPPGEVQEKYHLKIETDVCC